MRKCSQIKWVIAVSFKKGQITALLYFCFILVFIIKVMNAYGKFKVFFK